MQQLTFDLNVDNKQAIDSINAFFDIYEKGVDGMAKMMGQALGQPVEKKVTIALEGDKLVAKEVDKASKAVSAIEVAAKAMNGEFGKTPNALKRQLTVLKAIQGDTKKFNDETGKVTGTWKRLEGVIGKVNEQMRAMGAAKPVGNLGDKLIASQVAADGLMGALRGVVGGISAFIRTGADMEVLFIQLQGFTGGVQQAADAYQRFVEIGQATPFTAKQVATAARTMMGFGIETDAAIAQVERLAIVASATGGELTHMARNLGQIQANQKAYTRDLMQFANQGIPIYQKMAEILGVSTQEIRKMAEEGEIGFAQVSAAIRDMTQAGSAYAIIAEKMDNTWSAKMEAMSSAVESFAGNFLAMLSEMDHATGGLISGTLGALIDGMNNVSQAMAIATANMRKWAPAIAAVATGLGTLVTIMAVSNWAHIAPVLKGILVATKLWTLGTWALAAAQAAVQALMGNFAVIALAAGAAATVAAIAVAQNADQLDKEADALDEVNAAGAKDIETREKQAFATDLLTKEKKELIQGYKDEYKAAGEGIQNAQKRAQMAIKWQQQELKALKDSQKEKRTEIKLGLKEEKEAHKVNHKMILADYKEQARAVKEQYDARLDALDRELGLLDKKSSAELKLDALQKKQLQDQLRSLKSGSEEWLQAKIRLEQMDKQVKREKLLARQSEIRLEKQKKLSEIESNKQAAVEAEKNRHNARMEGLRAEEAQLDELVNKEKENVQALQDQYDSYFNSVSASRFKDHAHAMSNINAEIEKVKELKAERIKLLQLAEGAQPEFLRNIQKRNKAGAYEAEARFQLGENRFTGGSVAGGSNYTVNELGKEAFLSASGKLSMINAPSFGQWKAPSSGTVIPAHLTKQLDIPAGGVDISKTPGMTARGVGSAGRTSIRHGDNFNNNVTIQAANPAQAANNMMVELTKIKRGRMRR